MKSRVHQKGRNSRNRMQDTLLSMRERGELSMRTNRENFWAGKLGHGLFNCIFTLDKAFEIQRRLASCIRCSDELDEARKTVCECMAQLEVYEMIIEQLYGISYVFTRNDECFGLIAEDGTDWIVKIDR